VFQSFIYVFSSCLTVTENEVTEGVLSTEVENKVLCFHRNLDNIDIKESLAGQLSYFQRVVVCNRT